MLCCLWYMFLLEPHLYTAYVELSHIWSGPAEWSVEGLRCNWSQCFHTAPIMLIANRHRGNVRLLVILLVPCVWYVLVLHCFCL